MSERQNLCSECGSSSGTSARPLTADTNAPTGRRARENLAIEIIIIELSIMLQPHTKLYLLQAVLLVQQGSKSPRPMLTTLIAMRLFAVLCCTQDPGGVSAAVRPASKKECCALRMCMSAHLQLVCCLSELSPGLLG